MFKLKKAVLVCTAAAMLLGNTAVSARELFSDVPETEWAAPYIYNLTDRKIIGGYGDGTFLPWNNVQRCEFAKMLVNITGTEIIPSSVSAYTDVPYGEWYFPYVNSSTAFMTGYQSSDGKLFFSPNEDAKREDVAVAMVKALSLDLSAYDDPDGFLASRFGDWEDISVHNRRYICAAVDKGVITGDMPQDGIGTFRPGDPILRAEIVAVLYRSFPDGSIAQLRLQNKPYSNNQYYLNNQY